MIVKEGWVFVISCSVAGIACISVAPWMGMWAVAAGLLFLTAGCFCLYFFRDPERIIPDNKEAILSSGDGVVLDVVNDYQSGGRQGTLIKIFLSVFNVHVQRSPVEGTIEDISYNKGKFLPAMNPSAFLENEKNTLVIKHAKGIVEVSQIAGLIARRIICWFKKGDVLKPGQRFGLICFGSQVDMLLPDSVSVKVKKGDRVRAGSTIMGEWL